MKTVVRKNKAWIDVVIMDEGDEYRIELPDYAYSNWPIQRSIDDQTHILDWIMDEGGFEEELSVGFGVDDHRGRPNKEKTENFMLEHAVEVGKPFRVGIMGNWSASYDWEYGINDYDLETEVFLIKS